MLRDVGFFEYSEEKELALKITNYKMHNYKPASLVV